MAYTSVRGPDIALPERGPTGDITQEAAIARDQAAASSANAAGSASTANFNATRAETAANAASVNANVYPDVATGRAAVADGQQFQVISGNETIRYRRDSASTQTELVRFPTAKTVSDLALNSGVKKYTNLLPRWALTDQLYNANSFNWALAVAVPSDDVIYSTLGVEVEMTGANYQQPSTRAPVAALANKWVTIGHIARDPEGVFHTNTLTVRTADNLAGTTNTATHTPGADGRGTIVLDGTHQLHWAQVQMPAGVDGKYVRINEGVNGALRADFIAAPFIVISDNRPAISELNIFPGEAGLTAAKLAEATDTNPLLDKIGAPLIADQSVIYAGPATAATVTTPEIVEILPSGSVIELPFSTTLAARGTFIYDAGPGQQGKYAQASVYVYDPTGTFAGITLSFFLRNGTTNVALLSQVDTLRMTKIGTKVRRYDLHAQFRDAWSNYGIAVQVNRAQNTGPAESHYTFGFMAAVTNNPRLDQQLQPTAWVPKGEFARSFQLSSVGGGVGDVSPWLGKKIVWMGTSIPEGGGYPEAVASALGAGSLANIAYGGGAIRAFQQDGSWFPQNLLIFKFTLEIADINARYGANIGQEVSPTNYLTLQPGSGFTLTQANLNALVAQNWVARLQPHILSGDLFVFDYGVNDRGGQTTFPFEAPTVAGYDRRYFAGGTNYIYKQIYDARKAAGLRTRAVFLTHHNRSATATPNVNDVVEAQIAQARYWGAPLINIADNAGLNFVNILDEVPDSLHFAPGTPIALKYQRQAVEALKRIQP